MAKKRILIVEDEHVVAQDLKEALTNSGYEVTGLAHSGEDAIEQAMRTRPDLAVMDIVLRGAVDGIDAARQMRPLGVSVVYLTGYSDQHMLERAQDTEPLAYVLKPAQTGELAAILKIALFKEERERERQREQIIGSREADEQLRLMVAGVTDHAIFTLDLNGNVKSWNDGAERINGYTAQAILGMPYAILFTTEDQRSGVPEQELKQARHFGLADDTRWLVRQNGERYWADGTLSAIHDSAGTINGFAKITRDTTERRLMQEALRKGAQRLRVALHAARMGTWDWEIDTDTETLDDSLRALFGLAPEHEIRGIEDFFALLHPDDQERVRESFRRTRQEGIHLDTEFRVIWPGGTERWFIDQGEVVYHEDGRPARLTGACVDITERKMAEQALRRSEERLRLFVTNVRDYALFQMDTQGIIVSWNSGAESALGYPESEIVGKPGRLLFVPEDVSTGVPEQEMREAALTGRAEDVRWHLRRDGARFWASGVLTAMRDEGGRLLGFAKVMRDETERREAEEKTAASLLEKEVLLKEIHHRVKNNLQVITSLLTLQSATMEDETVRAKFEEACNRVQTIGDIHALLYRSPELARVDFGLYFHQLGQNLFSFYGIDPGRIRLLITVQNAQLEIAQAIPCGLVVNELLTNCLKHAFPEERAGSILLSLNCESGTCVLEVADNGVGMPAGFQIFETTSLGMKLISVLASQLQGQLVVNGSHGSHVSITFPYVRREEWAKEQ